MSKRFITYLILTSMLLSLNACGGGDSKDTTSAANDSDSITSAVETDNKPKLAISKEDNGGKTFTMLIPTHASYEYDVEQTGEIVDDAIYNRNTAVEELLGIKFEFIVKDGHWDQRASFVNAISSDILSGGGEYDLISGLLVAVAPSTQEGYYVEGKKLEYCDFSNPWWIQDMYENFSIQNKLYEFVGDASLTVYKDLAVVYFNKRIFNDYKLESPYDLVRNGTWTIDKLIELGTATGKDLNGDGKYDYVSEELGTICERMVLGKMEVAIEVDPFEKVGDTIKIGALSEKFIDAYTKLYNFVYNSPNVVSLNTHDNGTYQTAKYFGEGRFGMTINFLKNTELIRDMADDFGIVPMPKYDEEQEKYLSSLGTSISVMLVPKTTSNIDLTSKVMESLCYYSYTNVVPKYYEVALKSKYSRDEEIKEMLDIIRSGATLSFGMFNAQLIGQPLPQMIFTTGESYYTPPGELASKYASNVTSVETKLNKVLENYSKID